MITYLELSANYNLQYHISPDSVNLKVMLANKLEINYFSVCLINHTQKRFRLTRTFMFLRLIKDGVSEVCSISFKMILGRGFTVNLEELNHGEFFLLRSDI